jgi:hypothetical protein
MEPLPPLPVHSDFDLASDLWHKTSPIVQVVLTQLYDRRRELAAQLNEAHDSPPKMVIWADWAAKGLGKLAQSGS